MSFVSCKIVLAGETGVGKTTFVQSLLNQHENAQEPAPTLSADFKSKIITVGTQTFQLQIWDTAGQERFRSITKPYFRGSVAAFVLFDLTDRDTFTKINNWIEDIKAENTNNRIFIILIGNKSDIVNEREISHEEIMVKAEEFQIQYFETSAKIGKGINESLRCLIEFLENNICLKTASEANSGIVIVPDQNQKNLCC